MRLRDVARIELGTETYFQHARLNGKPAGIIAVYQTPGSNALAVADGGEAKMEELSRASRPTWSTRLRSTRRCR